jgi:hypothetical protein
MSSFKFYTLLQIFLYCIQYHCYAQKHLLPPNGGDGIPGPYYGSFEITWASVDNAVEYEYVMSNNPLCFAGCPGDTRQRLLTDTVALEYNLQEDVWYYWITRVIYGENDTTGWSNISSFLAKTPESGGGFLQIYPNPSLDNKFIINVDWTVNPVAKLINVELINYNGFTIFEGEFNKTPGFRFQNFAIDATGTSPGVLICVIKIDDNPNNPNNTIIQKIIIN